MIRTIFLATAMTVAAPVLAQTVAPAPRVAPVSPATSVTTVGDPTTVDQSAQPVTQTAPATPDQAAAGQVPAGDQVAQAVDTQFGTYDKNADGKLDRTEFSAWMVALKTASDPTTKAESAATKKWVGAAFAQADTDKNRSLDKAEVTGFLAKGQS